MLWYGLPVVMLVLLLGMALIGHYGVTQGVLPESGGEVYMTGDVLEYTNTISYILVGILFCGIVWVFVFLDRRGFKF